MTTPNQYFWEQGNWKKLYAYILHPEDYPRGLDPDHRYWEDIRKRIYCLANLLLGVASETGQGFPTFAFEGAELTQLKYEKYKLRVAIWNADFNRYFWYVNKNVLYGSDCNTLQAPPAAIHPNTYDNWVDGEAVGDNENRFYPDAETINGIKDGVVYLSTTIIAADSPSSHIPPPQNPDWVKDPNWKYDISSCQLSPNNDWLLVASPHHYHDYDLWSLFRMAFTEASGDAWNGITLAQINTPAHYWLPQQTDPRRQYSSVRFADTGKTEFRYKDKVRFDKRHTSQAVAYPGRLKPPNSPWIYDADGTIAGGGDPLIDIVRKGYHKLKPTGSCHGTQFAHQGGTPYNWPASELTTNPEILPEAEPITTGTPQWLHNPNVCAGYYNFIMALLSQDTFKVIASSTYNANWRLITGTGEGEEDQGTNYDSIPTVSSSCHAQHESGIELYLYNKYSGACDSYFDLSDDVAGDGTAYVPETIVVQIIGEAQSESKTIAEKKTEYGLEFAGCYRNIFRYSHRNSPWMRDYSRGTPTHYRDNWNPLTYGLGIEFSWFGSRTTSLPPISEFDSSFATITKAYKGIAITDYASWSAGTYGQWTVRQHDGDLYESKIYIDDDHKNLSPDEYTNGWRKIEDFHQALITGDVTADLKKGYFVHFCEDETDIIYTEVTNYGYVTKISYDEVAEKTVVDFSVVVTNTKIGWDKNISERHDPIDFAVVRSGSSISYMPDYGKKRDCLILAELRDILSIVQYAKASPNMTQKSTYFEGSADDDYYDSASWSGAWSKARGDAMSSVTFDIENPPWGSGWESNNPDGLVGTVFAGGVETLNVLNYELNPPYGEYENIPLSTAVGSIYATAIKLTWPDSPIENLPPTVLVKFAVQEDPHGDDPNYGSQSSGFLHNYLVPAETSPLKWHYNYARMPVNSSKGGDNKWHVFFPNSIASHKYVVDNSGEPDHTRWDIGVNGIQIIAPVISAGDIVVEVDWTNPPKGVFKDEFIGHIDAAVTPVVDKNPPTPNPLIFYRDPQAFFKTIAPYGVGKITEYTTFVREGEYQEDDYVIDPSDPYEILTNPPYEADYTTHFHLYRAKEYIEIASMHPSRNPAKWEWVPPTFELWVTATSCECIDDETISEPVKYKLVGVGTAPSGEFLVERELEVLLEEFTFTELFDTYPLLNIQPGNPSGTISRIYCEGADVNLTVGETAIIRNEVTYNGKYEVLAVGTDGTGDYFDIDMGWVMDIAPWVYGAAVDAGVEQTYDGKIYRTNTSISANSESSHTAPNLNSDWDLQYDSIITAGATVSAAYTETDWLEDVYKDYEFQLQAKDSASPTENFTKLSEPILITTPEAWPADLL